MIQIIPRGKLTFGEQMGDAIGGGLARGMERGREESSNRRAQEQSFKQKLAMEEQSQASAFKNKMAMKKFENDLRLQMLQDIESGKLSSSSNQNLREDAGVDPEVANSGVKNNTKDPFLKSKQYAAMGEHDLSSVASKEVEHQFKVEKLAKERVSESFNENKEFIGKVQDQVEDAQRKEGIFERMIQLDESGELSDSFLINSLEQLGLSAEFLKNPANEEYSKLALDLLGGGSLQADYGSRILQSEFLMAMKRIPTLNQTPEGRRQIIENLKAMTMPARLKNERMQYYIDRSERTGEPLPHNLRGKILKDIAPQLQEASDSFKQRNGRYKVKDGTYPDDQSIEKYYFLSDGDDQKAEKMMRQDGYGI